MSGGLGPTGYTVDDGLGSWRSASPQSGNPTEAAHASSGRSGFRANQATLDFLGTDHLSEPGSPVMRPTSVSKPLQVPTRHLELMDSPSAKGDDARFSRFLKSWAQSAGIAAATSLLAVPLVSSLIGMTTLLPHALALWAPLVSAAEGVVLAQANGFACSLMVPAGFAEFVSIESWLVRIIPGGSAVAERVGNLINQVIQKAGSAAYAANLGLAVAPLFHMLGAPGALPVALTVGALAALGLAGQTLFAQYLPEQGIAPAFATLAYAPAMGAAAISWSFLAGVAAPNAVAVGLVAASGAVIAGSILGLAFKPMRVATGAFVEPHLVDLNSARTLRGQNGFVPPDSGVEFLEECRTKLQHDDDGAAFWLGRPIVNVTGPKGSGLTCFAEWFAKEMKADLIWSSSTQLMRYNARGFYTNASLYLSNLLMAANNRAQETGDLQVVVIENIQDFLPRTTQLETTQDFGRFASFSSLIAMLMMTESQRHSVVVLLSSDYETGPDPRLSLLSNAPAINLEHPTVAQKQAIVCKTALYQKQLFSGIIKELDEEKSLDEVVSSLDALTHSSLSGRHIENTIAAGFRNFVVEQTKNANTKGLLKNCLTNQVRKTLIASGKKKRDLRHRQPSTSKVHGAKSYDLFRALLTFSPTANTRLLREIAKENAAAALNAEGRLTQAWLQTLEQKNIETMMGQRILGVEKETSDMLSSSFNRLLTGPKLLEDLNEVMNEMKVELGDKFSLPSMDQQDPGEQLKDWLLQRGYAGLLAAGEATFNYIFPKEDDVEYSTISVSELEKKVESRLFGATMLPMMPAIQLAGVITIQMPEPLVETMVTEFTARLEDRMMRRSQRLPLTLFFPDVMEDLFGRF